MTAVRARELDIQSCRCVSGAVCMWGHVLIDIAFVAAPSAATKGLSPPPGAALFSQMDEFGVSREKEAKV